MCSRAKRKRSSVGDAAGSDSPDQNAKISPQEEEENRERTSFHLRYIGKYNPTRKRGTQLWLRSGKNKKIAALNFRRIVGEVFYNFATVSPKFRQKIASSSIKELSLVKLDLRKIHYIFELDLSHLFCSDISDIFKFENELRGCVVII